MKDPGLSIFDIVFNQKALCPQFMDERKCIKSYPESFSAQTPGSISPL